MSSQISLRLAGVSGLDAHELSAQLPQESVSFAEPEKVGGESHGQLDTATAIFIYSPIVLQIVGAWLLKARRRAKVTMTAELKRADGSTEIRTITVDTRASEPPDAQIVRQLRPVLESTPAEDS